jgi:hypothetical protein
MLRSTFGCQGRKEMINNFVFLDWFMKEEMNVAKVGYGTIIDQNGKSQFVL